MRNSPPFSGSHPTPSSLPGEPPAQYPAGWHPRPNGEFFRPPQLNHAKPVHLWGDKNHQTPSLVVRRTVNNWAVYTEETYNTARVVTKIALWEPFFLSEFDTPIAAMTAVELALATG